MSNLVSKYRATAFSLVEMTLALGLSAFCLTAIMGLLPVGLRSSQEAREQTAATGLLSTVAADLRAAASTEDRETASPQFKIKIPANPVAEGEEPARLYLDSEGRPVAADTPGSRYRLTIHFLPNSTRTATLATLQLTWPAPADPATAEGSVQTFLALDRN